jgi:hypothetical protein
MVIAQVKRIELVYHIDDLNPTKARNRAQIVSYFVL